MATYLAQNSGCSISRGSNLVVYLEPAKWRDLNWVPHWVQSIRRVARMVQNLEPEKSRADPRAWKTRMVVEILTAILKVVMILLEMRKDAETEGVMVLLILMVLMTWWDCANLQVLHLGV